MNRRIALVTGGTRGIGLGIARALAKEGLALALCGVREPATVKGAVPRGALYVQADIRDRQARRSLLDAVRDRFGRLDVLVNNAGVAPEMRQDILHATEESYDRVMETNLKGPYFLTQAAAKRMIESRSEGRSVINISSISATTASVTRGEYCLSKAGIAMATKLWAARLAEFGIAVYEVRPGIIETDMTRPVRKKYDRLIRGGGGALLQPRWGTPEDVGRAVAALVRGDFAYSTGHVVMVDGGLSVERL